MNRRGRSLLAPLAAATLAVVGINAGAWSIWPRPLNYEISLFPAPSWSIWNAAETIGGFMKDAFEEAPSYVQPARWLGDYCNSAAIRAGLHGEFIALVTLGLWWCFDPNGRVWKRRATRCGKCDEVLQRLREPRCPFCGTVI